MTAIEELENRYFNDPFFEEELNSQSRKIDFVAGLMEDYHQAKLELLGMPNAVRQTEQLSCGRNITTCVFYKDGSKCSNPEYCKDQTT